MDNNTKVKNIIKGIAEKYNIQVKTIGEVINTSRGDEDRRYIYPINEEYMLKITNAKMVTDEYMLPINKLIDRYKDIGVYAPKMLVKGDGSIVEEFIYDGIVWKAYVEEYAKYPIYKDSNINDYELKRRVLSHIGKLASKYSNDPLCNHYSMWTIIHLHALDIEIDEKQDNLNQLCAVLEKYNYKDVVDKIREVNHNCRDKIKMYMDQLPTCTYQGDLNPTNILVDINNEFKGIIDFNMYGEEVNINCFINESMYYLTEENFTILSGKEIFNKMNQVFEYLVQGILDNYSMSTIEKEAFPSYKIITYLSFYPNVMAMIQQLNRYNEKVIELINHILT